MVVGEASGAEAGIIEVAVTAGVGELLGGAKGAVASGGSRVD